MKLTNKIALISTLGCLALVGTGFAAYIYNAGTNKTQEIAAGNVIGAGKETKAGTIDVTVATGSGIVLDSVKENGVQKLVDGKIQSVATWKEGSAVSAKFTPAAGNTADISYLTFNYTASIDSNIYVSFSAGTTGTWTDNTPITLPTLDCTQANAPQTPAEYDTMVGVLATLKITFTFEVVNA
jgi:hypothetical protein